MCLYVCMSPNIVSFNSHLTFNGTGSLTLILSCPKFLTSANVVINLLFPEHYLFVSIAKVCICFNLK